MSYLYVIAFTTGLVSSLHCVGMCGPLALALPVGRFSAQKAFWAKILYNLGRISTYTLLGLVFGYVGENIYLFNLQQKFSIVLGIVLIAVVFFQNKFFKVSTPNFKFVSFIKSKISQYINPKSLLGFYIFGLLNGLLPCAMIYLALTGAIVSASIPEGMLYMALFGLGTAPAMFAVLQFSSLIKQSAHFRKIIPVFSVIVSILLIIRGLNLGIPYLSPYISTTVDKNGITVCHGK